MSQADDDERVGRLLRVIRRRANQTQAQLAALAKVPRGEVINMESGRVGAVRLDRTRARVRRGGAGVPG